MPIENETKKWNLKLRLRYFGAFLLSCLSPQAPTFQVVPHTQKTPKPIVPKEKTYSSGRKNQKTSPDVGESSLHPESTSSLQADHL